MGKRKRTMPILQFSEEDSTQCAFTGDIDDTTARQALLEHRDTAQAHVNNLEPKLKELDGNVQHLRGLLRSAETSAAEHHTMYHQAKLAMTRSQDFLVYGIRIDHSKQIIHSPAAPRIPILKQDYTRTAGDTKRRRHRVSSQHEESDQDEQLHTPEVKVRLPPVQSMRGVQQVDSQNSISATNDSLTKIGLAEIRVNLPRI